MFTGDYHTRNVASVGIDMAIASVSGSVTGRNVTLILLNDNGTPENLQDDWGAFARRMVMDFAQLSAPQWKLDSPDA
jgi:hypothetical protein